MSGKLIVQRSCKRGLRWPQTRKNCGWKLNWGGGGRHLKELTAVALTLALIVLALIWFGASMLCCVILSKSLPSLKLCSGKDTDWWSEVVRVIWFTSRITERTSYMNNQIKKKKKAECIEKHLHSSACWGRKQCASSQRYIKLTLPYFTLSEASSSLIK